MAINAAVQAEYKALGDKLAVLRKTASEFVTSKKSQDGKPILTDSDYSQLETMRKEIADVHRQHEVKGFELSNERELERMNEATNDLPGTKSGRSFGTKSLGEIVTSDERFKNFNFKGSGNVSIDVQNFSAKTLMSTSAGFAAPNDRTDIVIMSAQRQLSVLDLFPVNETSLTTIKYMQETTATNGAATRAEGAALAESALAYTQQSASVTSIGHLIPVTEEQLEDVPMVQGLINNRMGLFIQQKVETQLVSGDGTGTNLTGLLNTSGIQTLARGATAYPDVFLKSFTKVRISGGVGSDTYLSANPSAILMNPIDFETLALVTDTTGRYIFGDPRTPDDFTIWGIKPTLTTAISQGTAIVGDFKMYAGVWVRQGVTVEVGYNNDDFGKLRKSIRGVMRVGLTVYRPGAFVTVTGL